MEFKRIKYFVIFILNVVIGKELNDEYDKLCWNDDTSCNIKAKLILLDGKNVSVNIDCNELNETDPVKSDIYLQKYVILKYYENIDSVVMDGCYANSDTFGFEFIPNSEGFRDLTLENFKIVYLTSEPISELNNIKSVQFKNNRIEKISLNGFKNIETVENLIFDGNGLKNIENGAFNELLCLNVLHINESELVILNSDIFSETFLNTLILSLQQISTKVLEQLPNNIEILNITGTEFTERQVKLLNPSRLKEVYITNSKLSSITLIDNGNITMLNLSLNNLHTLTLKRMNKLRMLDLSRNMFTQMHGDNFHQMKSLEFVYLQENHLKTLSMDMFKLSKESLRYINLSHNMLQFLTIKSNFTPNPYLKIDINRNPWNCKWILDMSDKRPQQYQMFTYDKYISRINVNGLECIFYPNSPSFLDKTTAPSVKWNLTDDIDQQAAPEAKKHQRTEALIVVLFLFIGVAILSVILYLWIKCQKVFHLSFYRALPRINCSPNRFDVVRQMPGIAAYEIPLPPDNNLNAEGTKHTEITYEEIPAPVRLYEEIKEYDYLKDKPTINT